MSANDICTLRSSMVEKVAVETALLATGEEGRLTSSAS